MCNPLEQFEVVLYKPISFFWIFDISITNIFVYLAVTITVVALIFIFGLSNLNIVQMVLWQRLLEILYIFVRAIVINQSGQRGMEFFSLLFTIFNFVFFSNLIGLSPLGFTITGQIAVTFMLAFSINLGMFILALSRTGLKYFKLFAPSEAPKAFLPLIVVIEVISYLLRSFSLSIRLFANMMAGHTLLFILSGFVLSFINSVFFVLAILPITLVIAVICLEVGIAFLQAYVFATLVAIYFNDALNFDGGAH